MIRLIAGGTGSGKTVSAVAFMLRRKIPAFSNIHADMPFITPLRVDHIITTKKKQSFVNWDFWKQVIKDKGGFDIYIDELHNIAHARRAMTKWNTNLSMWIAQIRKVLGTNERNDIILISQRLERVDVAFRDLLHEIIYCRKIEHPQKVVTIIRERGKLVKKLLPKFSIMQYHFVGEQCVKNYELFRMGMKSYSFRTTFVANPYFRYYNSYEIVNFGESVYL